MLEKTPCFADCGGESWFLTILDWKTVLQLHNKSMERGTRSTCWKDERVAEWVATQHVPKKAGLNATGWFFDCSYKKKLNIRKYWCSGHQNLEYLELVTTLNYKAMFWTGHPWIWLNVLNWSNHNSRKMVRVWDPMTENMTVLFSVEKNIVNISTSRSHNHSFSKMNSLEQLLW